MPQLIQRVPRGLLGLLDSKAGGENPAQLADLVSPSVELGPYYALSTRSSISQASSLTALGITAGIFTSLIVPNGECWLLQGLSANLSAPPLGAAATLAIQIGYLTFDTGRFIGLAESPAVIATGADIGASWEGQLLLQAGDQLNVYATTFTGGPHGVRLTAMRSVFTI